VRCAGSRATATSPGRTAPTSASPGDAPSRGTTRPERRVGPTQEPAPGRRTP
jgi:hypothetical protein